MSSIATASDILITLASTSSSILYSFMECSGVPFQSIPTYDEEVRFLRFLYLGSGDGQGQGLSRQISVFETFDLIPELIECGRP